MDRTDARVRECRDSACLLLEPMQMSFVLSEMRRQKLERDFASQPGILGEVDFAHPARAERRDDTVVFDRLPRRHRRARCFGHHLRRDLQGR